MRRLLMVVGAMLMLFAAGCAQYPTSGAATAAVTAGYSRWDRGAQNYVWAPGTYVTVPR
jgi:hypothetical protein